jgi:hypothetical protein
LIEVAIFTAPSIDSFWTFVGDSCQIGHLKSDRRIIIRCCQATNGCQNCKIDHERSFIINTLISINIKSESFGMKGKAFKKIGYIFFETSLRDFNKIYSFEALIINIIVKMETLLNSRLSRDASPSKLENLSP